MTATNEPAGLMVCFQFVTKDGLVVDSEPEPFDSIKAALAEADKWMKMKGQTLQVMTYEGFGVTVRVDALDLITAMPEAKMAEEIAKNKKLAEELYNGPIRP